METKMVGVAWMELWKMVMVDFCGRLMLIQVTIYFTLIYIKIYQDEPNITK